MAASSTNSWLHSSLLSPTAQQQSAQHALYAAADLPMHHPSHLAQQHHVGLGQQDHQQHLSCDTFCQPLHHSLNTGFHQPAENQQLHDYNGAVGGSCSGRVVATGDNGSQLSARKVHKADREKLRRDRLNEQFAELAGVLDPDRPKNDKATILGDSVQVVKELRAEVKRLRTEQTSLLDESRDLAQEKTELREEKASLKNETEQLQTQLQQRLRIMMPWLGMDPSLMMGAAPYPYPMAVPQAVSGPPPPEGNQSSTPAAVPSSVVAPAAYIPMAPTAAGAFAVHPAMQAYPMFGNRPGEAGAPFMPYPHYPPPPQVNSHTHVERPYAQYASPVQPLPAYLMQMQPHQGQTPMSGAAPVPPMYRSYAPGMAVMSPQPQANQQNVQARADQLPVVPYAHYPTSGVPPYSGPSLSSSPQASPGQSVQTTLQLQTPAQPQPQKPLPDSSVNSTEASSKAQTGGSISASSGENKESKQVATVSDSNASSPASLAPAASASSGGIGGDGGKSNGLATGSGANKENLKAIDKDGTTERPPVK
ncbi:hypothetical protein R1flu_012656 [Riccia fluitans]|uniref:BHLH domain-containing protein n=1 Tax=Riccia fluitans TaxID=41844 RepID=A0ABD1ZCC9_9MARC